MTRPLTPEQQAEITRWAKELRERKELEAYEKQFKKAKAPRRTKTIVEEPTLTVKGYSSTRHITIGGLEIGTVYLIGPADWRTRDIIPVKIGKAGSRPEDRVRALQTAHWDPLTLITASPPTYEPLKIERYLHNVFRDKNIHHEWYNLTRADIIEISELWDTLPQAEI